jgi:hypothetical protein
MDTNDSEQTNQEEYEYDEMNLSVSSGNTKEHHVMVTTIVSSDNDDDDKTVYIGDESDYKERHRGICENRPYIGIRGTECKNCDQPKWAQIVPIKSIKDGKNILTK